MFTRSCHRSILPASRLTARLILLTALAALPLFVACQPATAQANHLLIPAADTGWYDNSGAHNAGNPNYLVGGEGNNGQFYNNFFVFDLSGVSPQILSANLLVTQGGTVTEYPYEPFLTYDLYDVSTPVPTLISTQTGQTGIYQDLGSGPSFGTFQINTNYNYENTLTFTLNQIALQDLNAHRGDMFAIGGALDLSQIQLQNIGEEYTFAATSGAGAGNGFGADLALTVVPEASPALSLGVLLALGAGNLATRRKRTTKAIK